MSQDGIINLDWHTFLHDDPVERVLRALCIQDGHDQDAILASEHRVLVVAPDGSAELRTIGEAAWRRHTREASRLISAFRAFEPP